MRRSIRQKDGQFIVIAVLFISTMIISIGAMLYSTSTYYKFEPWEEYLTLIGNIELSSRHLVELSLSNFTHTDNPDVLVNNLEQWQKDLTRTHPGYGIAMTYSLPTQSGFDFQWDSSVSYSSATANFSLNITSLGLTGYKFNVLATQKLTIIDYDEHVINVTVTQEEDKPVLDLEKDNFLVENIIIYPIC